MTAELQKKVDRAVKLIQSAGKVAKEHGQPLEICYSGGKDSDVILELAKMSGVEYRAIYKNTTIDPPGTIKHVREKGVEVMQPKMSFQQVIAQKGMPNRWRRFCCSVLKEYKVLDYAVVGVRRDESRARSERYHEPEVCRVYNKTKGIKSRQYLPILDWTKEDIAEFIEVRGIKCHPLYYGGVISMLRDVWGVCAAHCKARGSACYRLRKIPVWFASTSKASRNISPATPTGRCARCSTAMLTIGSRRKSSAMVSESFIKGLDPPYLMTALTARNSWKSSFV